MLRKTLATLCLLLGLSPSAFAQDYNIQNVARLDILHGYPTKNGHIVAAHIQLKPGWKTYWRAPGGNGIPPRFNWSGSKNVGAVTFHWPQPTVYVDKGVRTIGYQNELILPIGITARAPGEPIQLNAEVQFGICQDVCLPVKARFSMNTSGRTASDQTAIKSALALKPKSGQSAGISGLKCKITPIKDGFRIQASLNSRGKLSSNTFVVFEFPHPNVWIEQDATVVKTRKLTAGANLYAYGTTPLILDRSKITLTLLGGSNAIELRGCPA